MGENGWYYSDAIWSDFVFYAGGYIRLAVMT